MAPKDALWKGIKIGGGKTTVQLIFVCAESSF